MLNTINNKVQDQWYNREDESHSGTSDFVKITRIIIPVYSPLRFENYEICRFQILSCANVGNERDRRREGKRKTGGCSTGVE
jgi:hypothetical protein